MSCGSELCCARIYYLLGKNSFCYSRTFLPCRKKWFDSSRIWRKCSFATNTCFPGSNKMSKEWTYSEAYFYNRCQFNNKLFEMKPFRLPSLFIRNKENWRTILQKCKRKLVADNAIFNKFNRSHVLGLVASSHAVLYLQRSIFLPNSLLFD